MLLFIAANVTLGYTFSTLARTQMQAMQMTFFFFLPSILLSGFMFPFRGMPLWAQYLGEVLPLTHFLRAVRGIMLKGSDVVARAAASVAGGALPARHRHASPCCASAARWIDRGWCSSATLARKSAAGEHSPVSPPADSRYSRLTSIAQGPGMHRRLAVAAIAAVLATPARAQDPLPPDAPLNVGPDDLVLELGIGAQGRAGLHRRRRLSAATLADRADSLSASAGYRRVRRRPETGLFVGPSFRYVPSRDEDDYSDLEGLGDVSAAYEFGATIGYRYDFVRGFLTLRQGFGGHHGVVGEVGVDLIAEPLPKLSVSLGPRLGLASSDYLDTYLGVDAEQSAASGLREFDPDGGIKGVGLEAEARYALTPAWSVVANAGYERLVGDAADSPVTDVGSENQFTAGIGVTYRFGLDLFKN